MSTLKEDVQEAIRQLEPTKVRPSRGMGETDIEFRARILSRTMFSREEMVEARTFLPHEDLLSAYVALDYDLELRTEILRRMAAADPVLCSGCGTLIPRGRGLAFSVPEDQWVDRSHARPLQEMKPLCWTCQGRKLGSVAPAPEPEGSAPEGGGRGLLEETMDELIKRYAILRFFDHEHLPSELQDVARDYKELAFKLANQGTTAPAEVAAGLRKLLEAKDCAVRAALS